MLKRILYAVVLLMVFASCILPLTSCGAKVSGMATSASLSANEYVENGNYSNVVVTVDVTNENDGYLITACSVKLYFKDAFGDTIDTKTVTFTDIRLEAGRRDSYYAVYDVEEGTGVVDGMVYSVSSQPYSMTVEKVEGSVGSFWSIVGIIGAVIGIVFVGGVIWGVFFD